jgi:hypothetical protein
MAWHRSAPASLAMPWPHDTTASHVHDAGGIALHQDGLNLFFLFCLSLVQRRWHAGTVEIWDNPIYGSFPHVAVQFPYLSYRVPSYPSATRSGPDRTTVPEFRWLGG